ncbi:hypothetical protein HY991_01055 [Candidatus Micrarchaeota archaeon]|nr:hypothetical protein [Candidatus Micrarchaeota archaeon]
MGLKEALLKGYFAIEDGYYKLMDALQRIGLPVYNWFVNPIESHGIPSFPAALLILIFLFFAAFLLLSQPQPIVEMKVMVTSESKPLSGVKVEVFAGEELVASLFTDKKGLALFENPEIQKFTVKASKEGYLPAEKNVDLQVSKLVRIELACTGATCFTPTPTPTPTCGDSVCDPGESCKTCPKDCGSCEKCKKPYVLEKRYNKCIKDGNCSMVGKPSYVYDVKKEICIPQPSKTAYLEVVLKDKKSGELVKANVSIYRRDKASVFLQNKLINGDGIFDGLSPDVDVYATANAVNYSPYDGLKEKNVLRLKGGANLMQINLTKLDPTNSLVTTIKTLDASTNTTVAALVRLYAFPLDASPPVMESQSSGELKLTLEKGKAYMADAYASQYHVSHSKAFIAGEIVIIYLRKVVEPPVDCITNPSDPRCPDICETNPQDPSCNQPPNCTITPTDPRCPPNCQTNPQDPNCPINSAELWVTVLDEFNEKISGTTSISLYAKEGDTRYFLYSKETHTGEARFGADYGTPLELGKEVVAVASFESKTGENSIVLSNLRNELTLSLELYWAEAHVIPRDRDTKAVISSASFTALQEGYSPVSCTGANCTLRVKATIPLKIKASAEGYWDYMVMPPEIPSALARDEVNVTEIEMRHPVNGVSVSFKGVYDSDNIPLDEFTEARTGREYAAKFELFTKQEGEAQYERGLFVRAVNDSQSHDASIYASIPGVAEGWNLNGRQGYAKGECTTYGTPPFSWAVLSASNTYGERSVLLEMKLRTSTNPIYDKLFVYYGGFMRKGDEWTRDPNDLDLGPHKDTATKKWCDADLYERVFALGKQGLECSPGNTCMEIWFQQGSRTATQSDSFEAVSYDDWGNPNRGPVNIYFKILRNNPRPNVPVTLSFSGDPSHVIVEKVFYPSVRQQGSDLVNVDAELPVNAGAFTLDLRNATRRLNYNGVIDGRIQITPFGPVEKTLMNLRVEFEGEVVEMIPWLKITKELVPQNCELTLEKPRIESPSETNKVTVYYHLLNPLSPERIEINCMDSRAEASPCTGWEGSCSGTCGFTSIGSKTISANPGGEGACSVDMEVDNGPTCDLVAPVEVQSGTAAHIQVNYARFASKPTTANVLCGSTLVAASCTDTERDGKHEGTCETDCTLENTGNDPTQTVVIRTREDFGAGCSSEVSVYKSSNGITKYARFTSYSFTQTHFISSTEPPSPPDETKSSGGDWSVPFDSISMNDMSAINPDRPCTSDPIFRGNCEYSYLTVHFGITLLEPLQSIGSISVRPDPANGAYITFKSLSLNDGTTTYSIPVTPGSTAITVRPGFSLGSGQSLSGTLEMRTKNLVGNLPIYIVLDNDGTGKTTQAWRSIDIRNKPAMPPGPTRIPVGVSCTLEKGVQTTIENINLKVDAVFPADVVPLEVSSGQGCSFSFGGSHFTSRDGSAACYSLEQEQLPVTTTTSGFTTIRAAVKYDASSGSCPRRFKPIGNTIPESDAKLVLTCTCGMDKTKEISLHVDSEESTKYDSLYAGQLTTGAEPIVFSLVNNMQIRQRMSVRVDKDNSAQGQGKVFDFTTGPEAQGMGFTGEGLPLNISERMQEATRIKDLTLKTFDFARFLQEAKDVAQATALRRTLNPLMYCEDCDDPQAQRTDFTPCAFHQFGDGHRWECRATLREWIREETVATPITKACTVCVHAGKPTPSPLPPDYYVCDDRCHKLTDTQGKATLSCGQSITSFHCKEDPSTGDCMTDPATGGWIKEYNITQCMGTAEDTNGNLYCFKDLDSDSELDENEQSTVSLGSYSCDTGYSLSSEFDQNCKRLCVKDGEPNVKTPATAVCPCGSSTTTTDSSSSSTTDSTSSTTSTSTVTSTTLPSCDPTPPIPFPLVQSMACNDIDCDIFCDYPHCDKDCFLCDAGYDLTQEVDASGNRLCAKLGDPTDKKPARITGEKLAYVNHIEEIWINATKLAEKNVPQSIGNIGYDTKKMPFEAFATEFKYELTAYAQKADSAKPGYIPPEVTLADQCSSNYGQEGVYEFTYSTNNFIDWRASAKPLSIYRDNMVGLGCNFEGMKNPTELCGWLFPYKDPDTNKGSCVFSLPSVLKPGENTSYGLLPKGLCDLSKGCSYPPLWEGCLEWVKNPPFYCRAKITCEYTRTYRQGEQYTEYDYQASCDSNDGGRTCTPTGTSQWSWGYSTCGWQGTFVSGSCFPGTIEGTPACVKSGGKFAITSNGFVVVPAYCHERHSCHSCWVFFRCCHDEPDYYYFKVWDADGNYKGLVWVEQNNGNTGFISGAGGSIRIHAYPGCPGDWWNTNFWTITSQ